MEQAQDLLYQLKQLNVQSLYNNPHKNPEERLDRISLVKDKIKLLAKKVEEARREVHAQYRHSTYLRQKEALPYKVLAELIDLLEISIRELEYAIKYVQPLPPIPQFGDYILKIRDADELEVRIVTFDEALNFFQRRGKEVKATLDAVRQEKPDLVKSIISTRVSLVVSILVILFGLGYEMAVICMPFLIPIAILSVHREQSNKIEQREEILSNMLEIFKEEYLSIKKLAKSK